MANVNTSKQCPSFEVQDLVTITRKEYNYLQARAHASDDIVLAMIDSQKALNAKIKSIGKRCREVF